MASVSGSSDSVPIDDPAETGRVVSLVGNPNSGKTTLFNALTGARQRVGNWPGVTVERKTGRYRADGGPGQGARNVEVHDLPGTYGLDPAEQALDQRIASSYLAAHPQRAVVNVIDASSLGRGLFLCLELLASGYPVVVALNMMDVAAANGVTIDVDKLAQALGCPVIPVIASKGEGLDRLKAELDRISANAQADRETAAPELVPAIEPENRYAEVDTIVAQCVTEAPPERTVSDRIDAVVLHRIWAFPIFLGVMYLMFMFSINVGSAFIDFFDLTGSVLFVEGPRLLLTAIGLPAWLTVLLADGVGGGVQLVGTFIPVIGALFLALAVLEDSGYMGRVAFVVDRLLKQVGLPGKSFVPLIVGFGCNVPAVMATRSLDSQPDRILTTLMAPFMSCGARLTVYALFAAAFFPSNGQNIVFALYLIGIAVAVGSALAVKKYLLPQHRSQFVMELPAYHRPTLKNVLLQTWQRLSGFVLRAGKAIVLVVVVLNVVNSIGTDGSVGNENSEKSALSAIGRTLTPVFSPMGIAEDNWPATVGIFTGIFAKEVVVGTLDALYAPAAGGEDIGLGATLVAAFQSIPDNLGGLVDQLADPLGLDIGDVADTGAAAAAQEVALGTIGAMQSLFDGQLGAFSYLLFVLLYMPCVATIGVIYKEIGRYWAVFSVIWSFAIAYGLAVICYQAGNLTSAPGSALAWIASMIVVVVVLFRLLVAYGRRKSVNLIPVVQLD